MDQAVHGQACREGGCAGVHVCVHMHETVRRQETGETLGRWLPCARQTPLTLTALLALRDSQGVPRVAEAQIGAHAVDAATFSSTRIFQALIFICTQARKTGSQQLQLPASPLPAPQCSRWAGAEQSYQKTFPQEPEGPDSLSSPGRQRRCQPTDAAVTAGVQRVAGVAQAAVSLQREHASAGSAGEG